jgi:hypothetical protein
MLTAIAGPPCLLMGGAENTTIEISGALINLWANFHTDD